MHRHQHQHHYQAPTSLLCTVLSPKRLYRGSRRDQLCATDTARCGLTHLSLRFSLRFVGLFRTSSSYMCECIPRRPRVRQGCKEGLRYWGPGQATSSCAPIPSWRTCLCHTEIVPCITYKYMTRCGVMRNRFWYYDTLHSSLALGIPRSYRRMREGMEFTVIFQKKGLRRRKFVPSFISVVKYLRCANLEIAHTRNSCGTVLARTYSIDYFCADETT